MAKAATQAQTQITETSNTKKAGQAGAKVTVYCKYPLGIKLRTFTKEMGREQVMGGGTREVQQAVPIPGGDYVIKGPATEINKRSVITTVGGYAVNRNVPKNLWDSWLADNKDTPLVKNELIFARPGDSSSDDHGQAKGNRKLTTGFEPLDPENDPRKPRPSNKNIGAVETEDGEDL